MFRPVAVDLPRHEMGLVEVFRRARRNILEIVPEASLHQHIVSGNTAGQRWHMVTDPPALRRILRDKVASYPKSEPTKAVLQPATGDSILIAEGEAWRWQRRAAAPAFRARNIAALGPVMTRAAEDASARLDGAVGRAADLFEEMVATAFDIINAVTFPVGTGVDHGAVHRALETYLAGAARLDILDLVNVPAWVPRPSRMFAEAQLAEMQAQNDAAIARRRADPDRRGNDLLSLLMAAEDAETGRRMDDADLRNNLLTFIVAGHETTALTLAWAFYLLAHHPDIAAAARAEAQGALSGRAATAEDLPALPLIRQIVLESLRLYPPAALLGRTAAADDVLSGVEIRRGDTVSIPIYALHRHRRLWHDPDAFRPDRFADGGPADRFAFLPFSDGPRVCIGAQFAIQEAVIVLATLIARFRFAPVPGRDPVPSMVLTLRPAGGVWLEVARA